MNARRLGALGAVATLIASGTYVFVYLYRWEWNRAQVSAAIFIAAEVGLVAWVLADRLRRLERQLDQDTRLLGAPPPPHDSETTNLPRRCRFDGWPPWTARTCSSPFFLGAGALLSGLAWLVEKVSVSTAGRAAERGLSRRLAVLEPPMAALTEELDDPLARLRRPRR